MMSDDEKLAFKFKLIFILLIYATIFCLIVPIFVIVAKADSIIPGATGYRFDITDSNNQSKYNVGNSSNFLVSDNIQSFYVSPYKGDNFIPLLESEYVFSIDIYVYTKYQTPFSSFDLFVYRNNTRVQATCDVGVSNIATGQVDYTIYPDVVESDYTDGYVGGAYISHLKGGCSFFNVIGDWDRISFRLGFMDGITYNQFYGAVINDFSFMDLLKDNEEVANAIQKTGNEIMQSILESMNQTLEDRTSLNFSTSDSYLSMEDALELFLNNTTDYWTYLDYSYDENSFNYVFDLIQRIFTSVPLVFTFVLSALSLGLIRYLLR